MSRVLPILFNTDMVRAILDGRKKVTRRLPSKRIEEKYLEYEEWVGMVAPPGSTSLTEKQFYEQYPPYQSGDTLYVKETWERFECCSCEGDEHGNCPEEPSKSVLDKYGNGCYVYRASDEIWGDAKWHSSIHMPKEAARIFLRVTDIRVERLQDITGEQCLAEGVEKEALSEVGEEFTRGMFNDIWDSTLKKSDLARYGWDANPWVWVIEFERIKVTENGILKK